MSVFRCVCAATALAMIGPLFASQAAAGDSPPAVAKTPLPALLDVTSGDLPKTPTVAVEIRRGSVAPGGATIWHMHPTPPFVYVESGIGRWEYKDGRPAETRIAGQAIEEPANVVTRIVNESSSPLSLVIFQVSKPGAPVLIPAP